MDDKQKILVIDALMGVGKTTWAVNDIDNHPDDNILYIAPYLTEIDRVTTNVKRKMKKPFFGKGMTKFDSLRNLLEAGEDIASTHALFMKLDNDCKEAIRNGDYTLYLDETITAVEPYELAHKDDMAFLRQKGSIQIDKDGFIKWTDNDDIDTRYNPIKILAQNKSLFYVNNKLLMWRYPPEIFKLFRRVVIMTYMFEASILSYYFKLCKIPYEIKSISRNGDKTELVEYVDADLRAYRDKIHIYDGALNDNFGEVKKTALSVTWFKNKDNTGKIKILKKNMYNYFRNKVNAKAGQIMWTTSKEFAQNKLRGKGYSNGFVSCNCRATNDYSESRYLAYCLNVYPHVGVSQFFSQHGIEIDNDSYALSEMVQWVWRSNIRKGGEIWIYIPSKRMRELFHAWLNNDSNKNF